MDYKQIKNSDFFKTTYEKIEELKKDFPVNHGFLHINNVLEKAKMCAEVFKLDKTQQKNLYIACVLHDIGYLAGRDDHAQNGGIMAKQFLQQQGFCPQDIDIISNAIALHGGKTLQSYIDPVARCLTLADKLDFCKSRYKMLKGYEEKVKLFHHIEKNWIELGKTLRVYIKFDDKSFASQFAQTSFYEKLTNCFCLASQSLGCEFEIIFV